LGVDAAGTAAGSGDNGRFRANQRHRSSARARWAALGHGVAETWDFLARELSLTGDLNSLVADYDVALCRLLAQVSKPLPGVRELVDALQERGVPFALASSSWPGWIEALLGGVGLSEAFRVRVSAMMVANPKPAPDIYLEAASKLGVDSEHCIAIEDTPTGLKAAKGAGMLCVQSRSASTAFPPQTDADIVLDSLRDFDLTLLGSGV
jgi:HAD superfamily hydrolase (TIGR01509 family)